MSVLTVADSDCRLIEIGNVAQATGGHVCQISFRFHEIGVLYSRRVNSLFLLDCTNSNYVQFKTQMTHRQAAR